MSPSSACATSSAESGTSRRPGSPRSSSRGFTLIELMVVIVILGLLIGLVVPNVWHMLTSGSNDTASMQMKGIADAISLYRFEKRSLPTSLEELTQPSEKSKQPFMEKIPLDPWKQNYEYRIVDVRQGKFEISTAGEDKQPGTDDDLDDPERATK